MTRALTRVLGLSTLLLVATPMGGCQDDLPKASQITHMRILGAGLEVQGDANRTTPKPGETARMTWSMAYPDAQQDDSRLASMFIVCAASAQFTGTPVCQELLDIARGGDVSDIGDDLAGGKNAPDCVANPDRVYKVGPFTVVCVTKTPIVDVVVAKDATERARLVQGIVCLNGAPRVDRNDPRGFSCLPDAGTSVAADDASQVESIAAYGTVPIQHSDEEKNDNPSIAAASFFFHDPPLPWNDTPAEVTEILSDETCRDQSEAKRVMHSEGQTELITLKYQPDARQQFDGEPEGLLFSGYTTYGELNHRFVSFPWNATEPFERTFEWEIGEAARAELVNKSKRVRFYFTLTDQRGGFAIARRDLCVNR